MILNAVTVGIIFSRVSFPQQRGRTIAISDSAIIARRDGILKFLFRIADIRQTQVTHLNHSLIHIFTYMLHFLPSGQVQS